MTAPIVTKIQKEAAQAVSEIFADLAQESAAVASYHYTLSAEEITRSSQGGVWVIKTTLQRMLYSCVAHLISTQRMLPGLPKIEVIVQTAQASMAQPGGLGAVSISMEVPGAPVSERALIELTKLALDHFNKSGKPPREGAIETLKKYGHEPTIMDWVKGEGL